MHVPLDDQALADLLPGSWIVAATNFPMWLSGERREPRFNYGLISRDPLVLSDDVTFVAAHGKRSGAHRHILGKDTYTDGGFVWRGTGMLKLFTSRWRVGGLSDDGSIAAIHFTKTLGTPAGVDIIVREGTAVPELRAIIAHSTEDYGLTPEQFASLTWLGSGVTV
ncbi:hypothetical protein IWX81_000858 [Salinibacterium sp. CAN_S4]|uniref:hypothetical protein n=1 Tax=Salinibacterium sp. CAN_S4 TaxID=2787727 RepID=UPI0018F03830